MYSDYTAEHKAERQRTARLYAGKEVWTFLNEQDPEPRKLLVDRDGHFQYWYADPSENPVYIYLSDLHPQVNGFAYVDVEEPDEHWDWYAYATKEAALSARATEIARRKLRDKQEES